MRILVVEDNPKDRELIRVLLESEFQGQASIEEAANLETGLNVGGQVDCVILDIHLPDSSSGQESFSKLNQKFPEAPIVVMTHNKDRQLALTMIGAGAADYIVKDYTEPEELFRRIVIAVEKHRYSVRMPPEAAVSIRRLDSLRHDSAFNGSELGPVFIDITQRMFAELQKLSIQQGYSAKAIERLDNRVDLLDTRVNERADQQVALVEQQLSFQQTKLTSKTKILLAVIGLVSAIMSALATYLAS